MSRLPRLAAPVESRGALSLREPPASVRAALGLPVVWGARGRSFREPPVELRRTVACNVCGGSIRSSRQHQEARRSSRWIGGLRNAWQEASPRARVIHVDIMDWALHLLLLGAGAVEALLDVILDVHQSQAPSAGGRLRLPGAHNITIHMPRQRRTDVPTFEHIREQRCRAGLAFCPSTPPAMLAEVEVDIALHDAQPRLGRAGVHPVDGPRRIQRTRAAGGGARPRRVDAASIATSPAVRRRAPGIAGSAVFGAPIGEAFRSFPRGGVKLAVVGGGRATARPSPCAVPTTRHYLFRSVARMLLESEGYEVVGEAP